MAVHSQAKAREASREHNWVERRLGRTVLRTYRSSVDLYDIIPNDQQPRMGPKEDEELQRQIEANEGLFEHLLVEPHPEVDGKYRIIDGDRRWSNSKVLVETHKKEQYRKIPVEITERTLTDDERLRVWVYIHRQRKEWDAKEKEMVAYRLVDIVGRASAANILGITVREVDKLVEIYQLSEKLTGLREPGASITWAREIKNLNKKMLNPDVMDKLIKSVNERELTNSKDIRKLRKVLKDPVAKREFLDSGSLEKALLHVAPPPDKKADGLLGDIDQLTESLKRYSWTALAELKGDPKALQKIEQTEILLKALKKQLAE